jgi:hypothetical protein
MHDFTERELKIIESLKTRSIKEAALYLGFTRNYLGVALWGIRNKIEQAQGTVNLSNSWKDSKRNPRLAKLLRRQEAPEEEEE